MGMAPVAAAELPSEVVTDILSRLPLRSVLRFRAICRSWATTISSDEFRALPAAAQAKAAASSPLTVIFVAPTAAHDATGVYSFSPSGAPGGAGLDLLFTLDDIDAPGGSLETLTAAPCRDLTLLHDAATPPGSLYVLNATTGAFARLPRCQDAVRASAGLGFDARSSQQHKVVRLFMQQYDARDPHPMDGRLHGGCEVYSLGGERRAEGWRPVAGEIQSEFKMASFRALQVAESSGLTPVLANGSLHWLLRDGLRARHEEGGDIMSFSIADETFGRVHLPHFESLAAHLVELNGHLCMVQDLRRASVYFKNKLEIWKLQDYASGVWSLDTRIDLSVSPAALIASDLRETYEVIDAIGDGGSEQKIIIATSGHRVRSYDVVSGSIETIFPIKDRHRDIVNRISSLNAWISLFRESLAPVHTTDEHKWLSTPAARALKEILLRFPATSVVRSKSVCKRWCGLISSDSFIRSYHARQKTDQGLKIPGMVGSCRAPAGGRC